MDEGAQGPFIPRRLSVRNGQIRELRPFSRRADRHVITHAGGHANGQHRIARVDDVVRQGTSAAIAIHDAQCIRFHREIRRACGSSRIDVQAIVRENPGKRRISRWIILASNRCELIAAYRIEAVEDRQIPLDLGRERRPLRHVARLVVRILGQTCLVRVPFEGVVCRGIDRRSTHTINLLAQRRHHGHRTTGRRT
jgi:hypothetical protein